LESIANLCWFESLANYNSYDHLNDNEDEGPLLTSMYHGMIKWRDHISSRLCWYRQGGSPFPSITVIWTHFDVFLTKLASPYRRTMAQSHWSYKGIEDVDHANDIIGIFLKS
jgi:hypothetical protein